MNHSIDDIKKEIDKVHIPEEKLNFTIKQAMKKGKRENQKSSRRIVYFSTAAVLLLGLFIGSAYLSPAMAKVASKIPFLNLLFESDKPFSLNFDELTKEGYNITNMGTDYRKKTVIINIGGSKAEFNKVRKEVKKKVSDSLQLKGLDAFKVVVKYDNGKSDKVSPLTAEQKKEIEKYMKQSEDLENDIMKELKKQNYGILSAHVRINKIEKFIPLEILVTEKRVNEMKEIVKNIVKKKNLGEFSIKVYRIDPKKEEAEKRWSPLFSTMAQGLMGKSEFKVTGFSYSFYPSPLTLTIRTSVRSTDSDAKKIAIKIENEIRHFITSEEVKEYVKDDPYKIIILSKDKKKINN